MSAEQEFAAWFQSATGHEPYPFQIRFACEPVLFQHPSPLAGEGGGEGGVSGEGPHHDPSPPAGEGKSEGLLVDVPTGLGKTAMAVLGWLWRRRCHPDEAVRKATPRRLVYCLPMRVLVEQTRDNAVRWLHNIEVLAGTAEFEEKNGGKRLRSYRLDTVASNGPNKVAVYVLMGGEEEEEWDLYPERDQILIGTQDMLLSRALNRGYAATRSRWPIQFGLLNTDCLWVYDEIQLMGAGLATTAQLQAFRRLLPNKDGEKARNSHGCRSVWMSATTRKDWLKTVDFAAFLDGAPDLAFDFEKEIKAGGLDEKARTTLEDRWKAKKSLMKAEVAMGDQAGLAQEVGKAHKPSTRTIVIVNTVKRACALFEALNNAADGHPNTSKPRIVLLHSRFRPGDRLKAMEDALADLPADGTIVVSTQVIEAGVDVSATTLFTELAPWASLVQRFGRCNRRGEDNDNAAVHWIAMPAKDADAESVAAPYELDDLNDAAEQLEKLTDVGLKSLPDVPLRFEHGHVIRRKDLIELFDTTPDLAGNDIDIDRFVRDVEESDVRVFWRDCGETPNETNWKKAESAPRHEELCPAPVGEFREFAKKHGGKVWRWSFLDKKWEKADAGKIVPGQVFLVHASAGGYSVELGWEPDSHDSVNPILLPGGMQGDAPDANEDERLSRIGVWQTIAQHTDELCGQIDRVIDALPLSHDEAEAIRLAARWHDRGKAHEIFQRALPDAAPHPNKFWAKAIQKDWKRYERPHFRHELASALSVLDPRNDKIPNDRRDLVAYLVAAHHGKVRLSIRSLPNELSPNGNRRFARGIWDGDELPETDLGSGVTAPAGKLSLEPMELGLCEQEPFQGQPSWAERMLGLRDILGPFRLAYLEAILRAADMRASKKATEESALDGEQGGRDGSDARK